MSSEIQAAIAGAIAGGVISVVGTLVSQALSARERRTESERSERERRDEREARQREQLQSRREEFLFRALEHFGGRTQERSVGIAIAEAYWKSVPEQIGVLVPLLLNQLVYLMSVVDTLKSADAAHEHQNVRRIVDLLDEIGHVDAFSEAYRSSLRAIEMRRPGFGIDLRQDPQIEARVAKYLDQLASSLG